MDGIKVASQLILREIILDHLSGLHIITRVLTATREEPEGDVTPEKKAVRVEGWGPEPFLSKLQKARK